MTDDETMHFDTKAEAAAYCEEDEPVALIRLTDHEADRAADKARIAELESALTELRDWYQDHTGLPACRANATLAHQALDACRSGGMKTPSCNYGD